MEAWETLPSGSTSTRILYFEVALNGVNDLCWYVGQGLVRNRSLDDTAFGGFGRWCRRRRRLAVGARDGAGAVAAGGAGAAVGLRGPEVEARASGVVHGVKFQPNLKAANMSNRTRTAPARILARNSYKTASLRGQRWLRRAGRQVPSAWGDGRIEVRLDAGKGAAALRIGAQAFPADGEEGLGNGGRVSPVHRLAICPRRAVAGSGLRREGCRATRYRRRGPHIRCRFPARS